jgi:probable blue pigment (indigoidine) exporter
VPRAFDLVLTALAPVVWGSTYIVTTELLPEGYPLTAAVLRALPAGLLLLLLTRHLPSGRWILRSLILGILNFSIFWWLLFVAAYELPGGVAATVGALQPLFVLYLARLLLDQTINPLAVLAGIGGVLGVALLVIGPSAALSSIGLTAAIGGAASMALGTVLSRKWQPPVSALTFTSWQLTAGGVVLLPFACWSEPALPTLDVRAWVGFGYLGLVGGALTYILWFRGIARLGPSSVAPLGLMSPVAATVLGWLILGQILTPLQSVGMVLVLVSVWGGLRALRTRHNNRRLDGTSRA